MNAWNPRLSIGGHARGRIEDGINVLELPSLPLRTISGTNILGAYLDLLHWMLEEPQGRRGRLSLPPGASEAAMDALASLEHERMPGMEIEVHVDGELRLLESPDFAASGEAHAGLLKQREAARPPEIVTTLSRAVDDPRFVTYKNLRSSRWFGKVEGLRLCSFNVQGTGGVLRVSTGKREASLATVYAGFREAVGADELAFAVDPGRHEHDVTSAASAVKHLLESRSRGKLSTTYREGRLEACVLRAAVPILIEGVGTLAVASSWGQFPTLWSPSGKGKELDVLMRHGDEPWAIELKHHDPAGIVSYYRHAVGQAVLYRTYIGKAQPLHDWFASKGMDARRCRAAVVLTKSPHRDWDARLTHVQRLAALFDVRVAVVAPD